MRAVIFQHEEHEGPGLLGPALEQAGFSLVKRFRAVRREDVDAELVVVMGGPMGVYEADQHPFLNEELAVLAERIALGRPCVGFCLGAQLLAAAGGSEVFVGKNGFEVGVAPVRWTQDGLKDPVVGGARPRSVVAHWHGDTFKPVPGATLLASTDRYSQQAFRLGNSYGFQFHLELTAAALGHWLTLGGEGLVQRGKDLGELRSQLPKLKAAEAENVEMLHRLAHHCAREARR
ncbi:glutamine amidotransferase [Corallococcus sp. M34]|uniref:type 1 glutamine amidotransferase n=1 Tax=Citreicoccus inhibens TaxID=2849499 RepID=UPI001C240515|nr:glutamine amidotransferase [Citreicoccus inhibens]MBU8898655.1 glutamine amidotransferase [Citreicoccus inhibens]